MLLTDTEKNQIKALLGYHDFLRSSDVHEVEDHLNSDFDEADHSRIQGILERITAEPDPNDECSLGGIDWQLDNIANDADITATEAVKLNPVQKMKMLKMVGTKLLRELANITHLEILFNKYSSRKHPVKTYLNFK